KMCHPSLRYAAASLLALVLAAPWAAAGPKVHALIAVDTVEFGDQAELDAKAVDGVLRLGMGADYLAIKHLKGKEATRDSIKRWFENLRPGRDDCVFFYFSG